MRTNDDLENKIAELQEAILEFTEVLQVALYDLSVLGRHDEFYVPRCQTRAHAILVKFGVTEIRRAPDLPIIQVVKLLPQVLDLLSALMRDKSPVYKAPEVAMHASNLVGYLRQFGVKVAVPKELEAAPKKLAKPKTTFNIVRDILSLVGKKLTRVDWEAWTEEMREEACDYAGAAHYRASDNDVKVPKIPKHVATLKDFEL